MITLYNIPMSGNCHKIRLLLSLLGLDYAIHDLDLSHAEQKSDAYLQRNPFGQAPVLDDNGIIIRDSQAILVYLASQYGSAQWWPQSPIKLAEITAWLSTAANEIANGPALLRVHHLFGREINQTMAVATAQKVLRIIDTHLSSQTWLVDNAVSIADIAIYPYIALAHQGKIDTSPYINITAWCKRIEALPNYIAMPGINKQPRNTAT